MSRLGTVAPRMRSPWLGEWLLGTVGLVAVLAAYFTVPIHSSQSPARVVAGTAVTLLGVVVIGVVTVRDEPPRHAGARTGSRCCG